MSILRTPLDKPLPMLIAATDSDSGSAACAIGASRNKPARVRRVARIGVVPSAIPDYGKCDGNPPHGLQVPISMSPTRLRRCARVGRQRRRLTARNQRRRNRPKGRPHQPTGRHSACPRCWPASLVAGSGRDRTDRPAPSHTPQSWRRRDHTAARSCRWQDNACDRRKGT